MINSALTLSSMRWARALLLIVIGLQTGCTTVQTTYFRSSYQPVENPGNPALASYSGESRFQQVSDMRESAADMYNDGYVMLGYSQFISPLYTSLAPGYATKFAKTLGAEYAVMETPQPGASNLHSYLVTYWSRIRPETAAVGAYVQELPEDLLDRLGQEFNVVHVRAVIPGTPASAAGLKRDDVVLAIDGLRVESVRAFNGLIKRAEGGEAIVSVSRFGKPLDVTIDLRNPPSTRAAVNYQETPWRYTQPTDWSSASAANVVANYQRQQLEEQRRQQAYEEGRRAAMAASASLTNDSTVAYGEATTRSNRSSYTRADRMRGVPLPSQQEWSMEYGSFLDNFDGLGNPELDSLDIWFKHAPNTYSQLFTFPRPQVY